MTVSWHDTHLVHMDKLWDVQLMHVFECGIKFDAHFSYFRTFSILYRPQIVRHRPHAKAFSFDEEAAVAMLQGTRGGIESK